jgi:PAS domain S-box-containing protein
MAIRVLIVEDSEDDALLICDELGRSQLEVECHRVDTSDTMLHALQEEKWDIIIADYNMPSFRGSDALRLLQETGSDIPFILVSGTASEDTGVEVMRMGAQDFILKHSLFRLGPAVKRELKEAQTRLKRRQAEEKVARLAAIVESSEDAIVGKTLEGVITTWNRGAEKIYGYSAQEAVGQPFEMLVPADRRHESANMLDRASKGEAISLLDTERMSKSGALVCVSVTVSPIRGADGKIIGVSTIARDITQLKRAQQRQRELEEHQREFYRRTISAATEGKLVISEPHEIEEAAGTPIASWQVDRPESFREARDGIRAIAIAEGMDEERANGFVCCAVEALANVHKHVGRGEVSLHSGPEGLTVVVADEGSGIPALELPALALTKGYTTAASLGMGYKIMIGLADRVYLSTGPKGTVVAIQMRLQEQPETTDQLLDRLAGR